MAIRARPVEGLRVPGPDRSRLAHVARQERCLPVQRLTQGLPAIVNRNNLRAHAPA